MEQVIDPSAHYLMDYTPYTVYTVQYMPQRTVYIRKMDEGLWDRVEDKARLVHDALHSIDITKYNSSVKERSEIEAILNAVGEISDPPVPVKKQGPIPEEDIEKQLKPYVPSKRHNITTLPDGATAITIQSERFSGPLCKVHDLPLDSRGRCLQKGCKYA